MLTTLPLAREPRDAREAPVTPDTRESAPVDLLPYEDRDARDSTEWPAPEMTEAVAPLRTEAAPV